MPNTALARLDTMTEPAIVAEDELDANGWLQPARPSVGAAAITVEGRFEPTVRR